MIQDYYEIDKNGYIVSHFKINDEQESPRPWWVKGFKGRFNKPRYINGVWVEDNEEELLQQLKNEKTEELKTICEQKIINGFDVDGVHYSYSQEKQINFQDTYQLFLNNMITEITWNAYINGEKERIFLDKESFQKVYLAGVKHKVDTIGRLNDVLIPMIEGAESKAVVARIYWDEGLDIDEIVIDENNTIGKKIEKVEKATKEVQDSSLTTMMALLQISSMIK